MHRTVNFFSYHIGLDLGKEADYSAVSILEMKTPIDRKNRVCGESVFNLLGLKRFPLKTPYPEIVREVVSRLRKPPFSTFIDHQGNERTHDIPIYLAVDKTGVGAPIFDLLRENEFLQKRTTLQGIIITGGQIVSDIPSGYNVPKRDLILSLVLELQKETLKISRSMPEAENLVSELENFEMKFSSKGNDKYAAKGTNHDDLVLSSALALWSAKNSDDYGDDGKTLRFALLPWRTQERKRMTYRR